MSKLKMPRPLQNCLAFFKCLTMRERKKLYANSSNFFAYLLFYEAYVSDRIILLKKRNVKTQNAPKPLHRFLAFFKSSTMKERTKLYANSSNFFAYLLFYEAYVSDRIILLK
jgi:hypothetical protein